MNTKEIKSVCILFLFFFFIPFNYAHAQSFGLGFHGYEVHQEKRTGLDLSPEGPLTFKDDFDISFDLTFRPNLKTYFGYVVRIIADDHTNIDLITSYKPLTQQYFFNLVIGDHYSNISFEIPKARLFKQWNHIGLKFDPEKSKLTLYSGSKSYSQSISLNKKSGYKILFGANIYRNFETTDVPAMIISNVNITEGSKLKYRWLLNDYSGTIAHEDVKENNASVINPLWIKEKHHNWELVKSLTVADEGGVGFDRQNAIIYITGKDSVLKYLIAEDSVASFNCFNQQFLIRGTQSVYVPYNNSLLDINIDRKQVSAFNFSKKQWNQKLNDSLIMTSFYHYNKFYSPVDTSLYMIGGYGYHKFKNDVQRYHLPTKKWEIIKTGGDYLYPHYLSALGVTKNGAYILGGYGSITGEQSLNPRYFYTLTYFNVKTRSFEKIYDLNPLPQDFVFANSMVINEADSTYYALLFDKNIYNSKLQLITGSLNRPGFKKVGCTIPFTFQDTSAFADLFYCSKVRRFVAVVLNHNEQNKTRVNIYSLYDPPVLSDLQVRAENKPIYFYWFYLLVALIVLCMFILYYKKWTVIARAIGLFKQKAITINSENKSVLKPIPEKLQNTIFLFGDLQVFDAEGNELTKCFTPLIKELFLVIIIYSIRWGRGISSEKLEELLWSDKTINNAHSNRSVNIGRLKSILEKMDNCTISKESGYWKIDIDNDRVIVDYKNYLNIINDKEKLTKQKLLDFIGIVNRGCFLSDVEFEWLDAVKSEIANEIIDIYLEFAASIKIADDPKFLVQLTNYIFNFDPVNEEAMIIKCKSLAYLGKHSLAKTTFENFSKEYEMIYGEKFKKDFHYIMDDSHKIQI